MSDDMLEEIVKNVTRLYGIHEQTLDSIRLLKQENDRLNMRLDAQGQRIRALESGQVATT